MDIYIYIYIHVYMYIYVYMPPGLAPVRLAPRAPSGRGGKDTHEG